MATIKLLMRAWNNRDIELLKTHYPTHGKKFCMRLLNRTESSIRYKASELKLRQNRDSSFFKDWQFRAAQSKIGKKRPGHSVFMKEFISKSTTWKLWSDKRRKASGDRARMRIATYGHPKGMLHKKHSDTMRLNMSERVKREWKDPLSKFNSKTFRENMSKRQSEHMHRRLQDKGTVYSRSKNGWYRINDKINYFRSGWEVMYARYLEWLLGRKEIQKWEFEADTFWFNGIKRGVMSYLPDFKVFLNNGNIEYHEVKGWMDDKSKTKIKRMAKYYPSVKLIIIDKFAYKDICKFERMFPESQIKNSKNDLS